MKVLFISNYREMSGYSEAARNFIVAMDYAGINTVCRNIRLTQTKYECSDFINLVESRSSKDCDVCVQFTLPIFFEYNGNFRRNIGMFTVETDAIPQDWVFQCNLMDEIWVSSNSAKIAVINSGVKVPVHVVHIPIDQSKYNKTYGIVSFKQDFKEDFIFYTVSELTDRKNIEILIRAFNTEFKPFEQVQLVLKLGVANDNPHKYVSDFCNGIKNKLRLYKDLSSYNKEIIITDQLNDLQLNSLHNSCDCFVTTSHGEGACLPAIDAYGFKRFVICPAHTSFYSYLNIKGSESVFMVNSVKTPCFGLNGLNVNSAHENWYDIDVIELQKTMRFVYENHAKLTRTNSHLSNFSYNKIGNKIKDLLDG